MKILILTQPLGHNYGGILQAFALQQVLKKLGHEVETCDIRHKKNISRFYKYIPQDIVDILLRILKKKNQSKLINFVAKNLQMSPCVTSNEVLDKYFASNDYDAVIVGSDQVWRPKYSPNLYNFFLDFLDKFPEKTKRISYAASFGVDDWEFSDKQTKICKPLINKFDNLSVREESAIALCQKHFDVTPKPVLDPTMLLNAEDYKKLFTDAGNKSNNITTYFLDENQVKIDITQKIATFLEKPAFHIMQHDANKPYISIESFLKNFSDSDYIITDSFHGTVFAIIFNKPFIAIGNKERGLSRFRSLLSMFGLEDRLILPDVNHANEKLISNAINWDKINQIRLNISEQSKKFLIDSLDHVQ